MWALSDSYRQSAVVRGRCVPGGGVAVENPLAGLNYSAQLPPRGDDEGAEEIREHAMELSSTKSK
jgi:hypothetical protein